MRGFLEMKTIEMDEVTQAAVQEFKARLIQRYGKRLKGIYLFGSRARGDYRADSDVDLALFIEDIANPAREQWDLVDDSYPILLSHGVYIEPWVFQAISLNDPDNYRAPHLVRTVQREGISL